MITKTYDLILWSCQHTSKFPRQHRFVLGERMERNLYDLLETLIQAKYTRERTTLLRTANLTLEILRFQIRLAKDLDCLRINSCQRANQRDWATDRRLAQPSKVRPMKRHGHLWPTLTSFPHLLKASQKAKRGKRFRSTVTSFEFDLEPNLLKLQQQLKTKAYQPGDYHTFFIHEPKKRQISAAPYRDRIVHP